MTKETYSYDKRNLFIWHKRPTNALAGVCRASLTSSRPLMPRSSTGRPLCLLLCVYLVFCTYAQVCVCVCAQSSNIFVHVCIVHTYIHVYVCVCVCVCVCVLIHAYMHMCAYTHKCPHTHETHKYPPHLLTKNIFGTSSLLFLLHPPRRLTALQCPPRF